MFSQKNDVLGNISMWNCVQFSFRMSKYANSDVFKEQI